MRKKENYMDMKKIALIGGSILGIGAIGYVGYKMYKKHQEKKATPEKSVEKKEEKK